MIAGVLFGVAQIEHEHIRERQAIGIAAAKKKGVYTGRKARTTKAQPARAHALRKQGLTIPEIAHALGVKQRTVFNYLRAFR
jgi:DNA invertase Pin-like site-specific DNA recombinase